MLPRGLLPRRAATAHKGEVGHVLVIAGSAGLSGAAALCSRGALRSGAGLVTLAVPRSVQPLMAKKLTEVMTASLPETSARTISLAALPTAVTLLNRATVLAIGPGLSQQPQTQRFVRRLLPRATCPCVVDADALNALAAEPSSLARLPGHVILTPHPGEMARLIRRTTAWVQRRREETAKAFAHRHGVVLVLKGHRTIVASPDGALYMNATGNPGMASGGMGDALTGMIAALIAQTHSLFDAARLGVYLHGLAGDLAASRQGTVGLIASDLIDTIPQAIRRYQRM